jgi:hypothetical protein
MARALSSPAPAGLPPILSLERALLRRLARHARRCSLEHARRNAIERFARSQPLWYQSLFDPTFLRSLPDDFFKRSPASVARSWTVQFPYLNEERREHDVEQLLPVAEQFLSILAEEEARLELGNGTWVTD